MRRRWWGDRPARNVAMLGSRMRSIASRRLAFRLKTLKAELTPNKLCSNVSRPVSAPELSSSAGKSGLFGGVFERGSGRRQQQWIELQNRAE